jgi:ribokinase
MDEEAVMNRPKVTIVGSFNMDLSVRTPRMPVPGETLLGGPFTTGPGGKGANQAVAAARLGADVSMLVKLGQDVFGNQAAENLIREGINPETILRTDQTHTGVAFIIVDNTGENLIVVAGGANNQITPEDVERARTTLTSADILLTQLEIPMETVAYAVKIAHDAGVKVVLNPAPGQPLSPDLLQRIDILTPNETEAQTITGLPVTNVAEAEEAGRHLLRSGVKAAVITLGSKGSLVVTAEGSTLVPGRSVKVVDTTGAGDAFSGALVVALGEGKGLVEAAAFANAAAALQVTKPGTSPAMPYRDEVLAFMAE